MKARSIIVCVALIATALAVAAAPARASRYVEYTWGSPGYWLSSGDTVNCGTYNTTISHPGPLIGRSPRAGYTGSSQYIQMWPLIDYWDGQRWTFYRWGQHQARNVSPNYNAKFNGYTGDSAFAYLGAGLFRAGYFFRWSVNGTVIGEVLTYHGRDDYYGFGWGAAWCDFSK